MQQIIGKYKEFVIIEQDILTRLMQLANELSKEKKIHTKSIAKGIIQAVEVIKLNNIYNKEFTFKG